MSKYLIRSILAILIYTTIGGCDNAMKKHFDEIYTSEVYEGFNYDLSSPENVIDLPPSLNEISGLSYLDENSVVAIRMKEPSCTLSTLQTAPSLINSNLDQVVIMRV